MAKESSPFHVPLEHARWTESARAARSAPPTQRRCRGPWERLHPEQPVDRAARRRQPRVVPGRVGAQDLERDPARSRTPCGRPARPAAARPRRRRRARACRRASPTASAAVPRAARAPGSSPSASTRPSRPRARPSASRCGRGPRRRARRRCARIASALACERVVPRTAWPAATSSARAPGRGSRTARSARGPLGPSAFSAGAVPPACSASSSRWRRTLASISSSSRSGSPRLRRSSFCASIICAMSSMSFWASSSGERVGFQSRMSSAERLENIPSSSTKTMKNAERAPEDDGERVDVSNTRTGERATGDHRRSRRGDDGRRDRPARRPVGRALRCCTTPTPRRCERGLESARGRLERGIEKGRLEREAARLARGRPTTSPALAEAELVIEAAPEDLELKRALFTEVAEHVVAATACWPPTPRR